MRMYRGTIHLILGSLAAALCLPVPGAGQAQFHCASPATLADYWSERTAEGMASVGRKPKAGDFLVYTDARRNSGGIRILRLNDGGQTWVEHGGRRLPDGARVWWGVENKNPFRYKYETTVNAEEEASSALEGFFALLGGIVVESQADREKALLETSGVDARLQSRLEEAERTLKDASVAVSSLQTKVKEHGETLLEDEQTASSMKSAAEEAHKSAAVSSAAPQVKKAKDDIGLLETEAARVAASSGTNQTYGDVVLKRVVPSMRADLAKLEGVVGQIVKFRTQIEQVCRTTNAFVSSGRVDDAEVGVKTKVTVKLKVADSEKGDDAGNFDRTLELNVGESIFHLSGGLVYSSLRRREYGRVPGVVLNADGSQQIADNQFTTGTIAGLTKDSRHRFLPMVLLHTRVASRGPLSFGIGVGVTAKFEDEGTEVESLIGPSFGFWRNKFFLTPGLYLGWDNEFDSRFPLGAPVPESVTDLSPTKKIRAHFGVSISWKLR